MQLAARSSQEPPRKRSACRSSFALCRPADNSSASCSESRQLLRQAAATLVCTCTCISTLLRPSSCQRQNWLTFAAHRDGHPGTPPRGPLPAARACVRHACKEFSRNDRVASARAIAPIDLLSIYLIRYRRSPPHRHEPKIAALDRSHMMASAAAGAARGVYVI